MNEENLVKTEEYNGYTIKVYYDYYAEYGDSDHLGRFYTNIPRELNPDKLEIDEILDEENHIKEGYISVIVYAYIHSGIALSASSFADPWDSGVGGVMACTMDDARKWFGDNVTEEQVKQHLLSEVKELDDYCQGNVYGFVVVDEDCEVIDSCWGFVGDYNKDLMEYARDFIEYHEHSKYVKSFSESMMYAEAE